MLHATAGYTYMLTVYTIMSTSSIIYFKQPLSYANRVITQTLQKNTPYARLQHSIRNIMFQPTSSSKQTTLTTSLVVTCPRAASRDSRGISRGLCNALAFQPQTRQCSAVGIHPRVHVSMRTRAASKERGVTKDCLSLSVMQRSPAVPPLCRCHQWAALLRAICHARIYVCSMQISPYQCSSFVPRRIPAMRCSAKQKCCLFDTRRNVPPVKRHTCYSGVGLIIITFATIQRTSSCSASSAYVPVRKHVA